MSIHYIDYSQIQYSKDQGYLNWMIQNLQPGSKNFGLLIQMKQSLVLVLSCFRLEQLPLLMLWLYSRRLSRFLSQITLIPMSLMIQLLQNPMMRQQDPNLREKPLLRLLNKQDQQVALDSVDKSFHCKLRIDCQILGRIGLMKMSFLLKQSLMSAHQQPDLIVDYFDSFVGWCLTPQKLLLFVELIQSQKQLLLTKKKKWEQRNHQCYYPIYSHHSRLCIYCRNQRSYIFDLLISIFVKFYYNSSLYSIRSKQCQFGSCNKDQIVYYLTLPVDCLMTQQSLWLTHQQLRKMKMKMSTKMKLMILRKNYRKHIFRG